MNILSETVFENTLEFARKLDREDPLNKFREEFFIPRKDGSEMIYFCGNSLGLQPKNAPEAIEQEMRDWRELGVKGHFTAKHPWFSYHHFLTQSTARLVGAKESEVVVMNSLTVNLQLMLTSFYRPEGKRYKIMVENGPFPSDHYAVESQLNLHGYDWEDGLIECKPREGEHILKTEDIIETIERNANDLAVVVFGGVNYYSGQFFDHKAIVEAAHKAGAICGFDEAHATGNLPLKLHDWDADFAVWCSYKYLNSGPGGTSGVFVHERHGNNPEIPRLAGWWGNDEKTRFEMKPGFHPQPGAAGWQLSNAQVLPMAIHKASLEIFDQAGMLALREKSIKLTGYLEWLIQQIPNAEFEIITPADPDQRGCQLSILTGANGKTLHEKLTEQGVVSDWREPNVIRVAPVPLYNTFEEVYRFVQILVS